MHQQHEENQRFFFPVVDRAPPLEGFSCSSAWGLASGSLPNSTYHDHYMFWGYIRRQHTGGKELSNGC